jgi:hypothetical protein
MSLLDDIRDGRLISPPCWATPLDQWARHTARIYEILREPDLIDCVAHAYFESSDQEYWDLEHDFPPLIPPCPLGWFEYTLPYRIHSAANQPGSGRTPHRRAGRSANDRV